MKQFEYKIVHECNIPLTKDSLDQLGRQGWELVAVRYSKFVFKREIDEFDDSYKNRW